MISVFVAYSPPDHYLCYGFGSRLLLADEDVWLDDGLSAGAAWWREILEQIRACDVFIFALSDNSLASKPCRAELSYARALNKPILPVQMGPLDTSAVNPLANMHAVDYREATHDAEIEIATAVKELTSRQVSPPEPPPQEPPIPFAYVARLHSELSAPTLSARQQETCLADLRAAFDEDGHDDSARREIKILLYMLFNHPDVGYQMRRKIDPVLHLLYDREISELEAPPDPRVEPVQPA